MTPAQIEAAARELCKMRGLDPEASEAARWGMPDTGLKIWECARGEVERFAQVGTAIASVLQEPPKKARRKKGVAA